MTGSVPDRPPTVETLSMQIAELQRAMNRQNGGDTGRHRTQTREIASQVETMLSDRDEEQRQRARKTAARWIAAFLGAISVPGGGWIAWNVTRSDEDRIDASDVQRTVEHRGDELEAHVEENTQRVTKIESKIDTLEDIAVEQQVQIVDSVEYLSDKIDAVSPRARQVEEPETLRKAKRKAEQQRARRDLFGDE